jgi:hypothetical protein
MEVNVPVWDFYKKGYVDPVFYPYLKKKIDSEQCPLYTWDVGGMAPDMVYPELIRKGWGRRFQRKHTAYPCPAGFNKADEGYCVENIPEFEPIFYTSKSHVYYGNGFSPIEHDKYNSQNFYPKPRDYNNTFDYYQTGNKVLPVLNCGGYKNEKAKEMFLV